eukprot:6795660-Pyramimonas_sp.AAC.1
MTHKSGKLVRLRETLKPKTLKPKKVAGPSYLARAPSARLCRPLGVGCLGGGCPARAVVLRGERPR